MTFKPPYWYHDNIEFSYEDLKELKFDIDFIDSQKYAKEEQHISTYFCLLYTSPSPRDS